MKIVGHIEYTRIHQIGAGQGQNSLVFFADEPQLGGQVAVKEIPALANANYFNEAQAMFKSVHPNVVPIQYGCKEQNGQHVALVMRYFAKGSLHDRIKKRALAPREVLRAGQGVLNGLQAIHLAGYIHFDVKPSNVLFSDADEPLVTDFGQSRAISANGLVQIPPMYRPARPPETILHGTGSILSDIYHVGLTLYRAANGNPLYKEQIPATPTEISQAIVKGRLPNRKLFLPHVPKKLRTAIRKALRLNPVERFASAIEFGDALGRIDVGLNWTAEHLPGGNIKWTAARPDQPDLLVDLSTDGSTWTVQVHSQRVGEAKRARGRQTMWKTGLATRDDAFYHLESAVFPALT